MRYTARTGRTHQQPSRNGWKGTPASERVCVVCGGRVTLNESSQQHTDIAAGVSWIRHGRCSPGEVERVLRGREKSVGGNVNVARDETNRREQK